MKRSSWVLEEFRKENFQERAAVVDSLKTCATKKDIKTGASIHADILNRGLLEKDLFVASALVSMYAKCGAITKSKEMLEELPVRNVVSWNALIAGYVQGKHAKDALNCFQQMHCEGICHNAITLTCILKACGSLGALGGGEQIHSQIVRQGLLSGNALLGGALVDMYAKCGALARAEEVHEELAVRDVVSWSALTAGHVEQGHSEEALNCFARMQHEGVSPNPVTFMCILRACGNIEALEKGTNIHLEVVRWNLIDGNLMLGNALVDMYARCGALTKARDVLEGLYVRDIVSWSTFVAGYVQREYEIEALNCFQLMQHEGFLPNEVTYIYILKACGNIGALEKGENIHVEMVRRGLLRGNLLLSTALVDMYVKCRALAKAKDVLEGLPVRGIVLWNTLIAGYTQEECGKEALNCLERMQCEGLFPDATTFASILKACGSIRALDKGKNLHTQIVKQGLLGRDVVLGNALLDMYSKSGEIAKAEEVLEGLFVRNVVSWSVLIAGYVQIEDGKEALKCYDRMECDGLPPNDVIFAGILKACGIIGGLVRGEIIHSDIIRHGFSINVILGAAVIDMYGKCGAFAAARQVHEQLLIRNVVSWNALIGGYAQGEQCKDALNLFDRMQCEGLLPDAVTFAYALKACGNIGALEKGEDIHHEIIRLGWMHGNLLLGGALIDMYMRCNTLGKAKEVFEGLPFHDAVSWSSLIAGYVQGEYSMEALDSFNCIMQFGDRFPNVATYLCILKACGNIRALEMGETIHSEIMRHGMLHIDAKLGNGLVDMYAKCGALVKAKEVLQGLCVRDVVSWSALIAGYVQAGHGKEALDCFEQMQCEGLSPDAVTFICILKACGITGALDKGENVHCEIVWRGLLGGNVVLEGALVDMYAKCSALVEAKDVLEELHVRNVVSWNALLAGYAQGDCCYEALGCVEQMLCDGICPDEITFLCVLNTCSHSGQLGEGLKCFTKMSSNYGIIHGAEHQACMIILYGRAGLFDEAVMIIEKLSFSNDPTMWLALLSACESWGNVKLGKWAFEHAVNLG